MIKKIQYKKPRLKIGGEINKIPSKTINKIPDLSNFFGNFHRILLPRFTENNYNVVKGQEFLKEYYPNADFNKVKYNSSSFLTFNLADFNPNTNTINKYFKKHPDTSDFNTITHELTHAYDYANNNILKRNAPYLYSNSNFDVEKFKDIHRNREELIPSIMGYKAQNSIRPGQSVSSVNRAQLPYPDLFDNFNDNELIGLINRTNNLPLDINRLKMKSLPAKLKRGGIIKKKIQWK